MSLNRFVLDTNVLVSAALSPHSVSADALRKAHQLGILVYSGQTWAEFLEVLFRAKFDKYFSIETRQEIAVRFLQFFQFHQVNERIRACRVPKDDMFLELAIASGAACIVTGDSALLELHPFQNIPILSPSNFIATSY